MAPLSFINSLLIDYRCIIVPRYVYVTSEAFDENNSITDTSIQTRLNELTQSLVNITKKLN